VLSKAKLVRINIDENRDFQAAFRERAPLQIFEKSVRLVSHKPTHTPTSTQGILLRCQKSLIIITPKTSIALNKYACIQNIGTKQCK
jgi:hypothetical protein